VAFSGTRISGIGAHRPGRLVGNDELAKDVGVEAAWIQGGTGIVTRYHAGPDEDVISMAVQAGGRAMAAAGVSPEEIDLVILTTSTRRQLAPAGAPQVASQLGITGAGAFDLNAVCAGFSYALAMASNAVQVGQARHVLITCAEKLTDFLDPAARDTYVIFGDGAGAAVVSASDSDSLGIGPATWGSDGTRASVIEMVRNENQRDVAAMNGKAVYRWATSKMPAVARRACELAGVSREDIAWFVPHQANRRIIDQLATQLGFDDAQVARDVVDTGNTSSATIPLALDRLYATAAVKSGDLALLIGFGSGLSHSAQVVRLP
jgi:3-oxoacyl-[acyl-carrier-protein] synthase-3